MINAGKIRRRAKRACSGSFLSLDDFISLETFHTDLNTFDRAVEPNFYSLEIGQKLPEGFPNDLGTSTAFAFDHTAALICSAGNRTFSTNFAGF